MFLAGFADFVWSNEWPPIVHEFNANDRTVAGYMGTWWRYQPNSVCCVSCCLRVLFRRFVRSLASLHRVPHAFVACCLRACSNMARAQNPNSNGNGIEGVKVRLCVVVQLRL